MALGVPGLGSALDVNAIVAELMQIERRPLALLAARETGVRTKLSAYGNLKSSLAALQTAARTLASNATFEARKASLSDPTLVSVSVAPGAPEGIYGLEVQSLAQRHTLRSEPLAAGQAVGTGSLRIEIGRYRAQPNGDIVFEADPGTPALELTVGAEEAMPAALRDKINRAGGPVQASLIVEGDTVRLALAAREPGLARALRVTVSGDGDGADGDQAGLSRLLFDASVLGGVASPTHLTETRAASDAALAIEGVIVRRATNTIHGAMDGVSFELLREAPGSPTVLRIVRDSERARAAVEAFVQAYNAALAALRNARDREANGSLAGESTLHAVESRLRTLSGARVTTGSPTIASLSDVGVRFQRDGTLVLDRNAFERAISETPAAVAALFGGENGVATRIEQALSGMLGAGGLVAIRTSGLDAQLGAIARRREADEQRLARTEQRLRAQFIALDTLVSRMRQTADFMQLQLSALERGRK